MNDRRVIKILVMEDSEVYNSLLTKKLKLYTESLSLDTNCIFEIFSYVSLAECIKNLREDIDIVFIDYYLVKNITALDIFKKVKQICKKSKIFVISRTNSSDIINRALEKGVDDFIFKDRYAMARSCYLVKKVVYNS